MVVAFIIAAALIACSPTEMQASDNAEPSPLWLTSTAEPYPFQTPIPPLEATAIDGTYVRSVPARVAGSSVPCRRCAPYRIEIGTTTLELSEGRYLISHRAPGKPDSSQFATKGHFTISDDEIVLFNDANCPETRGTYRWSLDEERLTFEAIDDPCPFSDLRQRFFTALPWEAKA
ncbi:MAG: hypothetical protein M3161_06015 [Actinomycetota bacterium]|nr:hypothetical protein [Actinomycetota bacterium]